MNKPPAPIWAPIVVALVAVSGCRETPEPPPAQSQPAAAAAAAAPAAAAMPHGDHNPHHGGVVMMKGDMHYEAVFDPTGHSYHLYFTDAVREDLPAAIASSVTFTIHRADGSDEAIPLKIDDSGESWVGSGRPVAKPADASVRVAFTIQQEPYWIDLPFSRPG